MRRAVYVILVLLTQAFGLSGCAKLVDTFLAEQALDSVELAQVESALVAISINDYDGSQTVESLVALTAQNAGVYFKPAGCMTAEATAADLLTLVINDCTGPYGQAHMTGSVVIGYSSITNGIQTVIMGTDLKANKATLNLNLTAKRTINGEERTLVVTSESFGIGPRGNSIARSGDYTLTWNFETDCLGLDGTWTTLVERLNWSTTVTGYERCGLECPAAEGTIVFSGGIRDVTVTVQFDGSDQAAWSSSRGSSSTVLLGCEG